MEPEDSEKRPRNIKSNSCVQGLNKFGTIYILEQISEQLNANENQGDDDERW